MIEKTQKTYRCEYCRKLYVIKSYCERHEKYCKKNPKNHHACFRYCKYLSREVSQIGNPFTGIHSETYFFCSLLEKDMHSFIAQKLNLECVDHTERMPLKCYYYKHKHHDQYEAFDDFLKGIK